MEHKEKMRARRIRQLGRQAGFTPVYSGRINGRLVQATAKHVAAGKEPKVAEQLAAQEVRAGLPNPPFVRTRSFASRSKY